MKLSIVVPCFNEQEVLELTAERLVAVCSEFETEFPEDVVSVLFVDDGSTDRTWGMLTKICSRNENFNALRLSRNFGHQGALLAGMEHSEADGIACVDADLQDPPELLLDFGANSLMDTKSYMG